jgi:division protein CdvB (Snf7/Vps24/ESCRT-III family)
MPVTAKLSQQFYQRLGNDVANELVEWLNAVDTSYRQEFKDLFDANFRRLEAEMVALESRLEARMDALESRLQGRMESFESRVDAKLEALKSELLRWMFLFWVGTMGTVLAILKL